MAHLSSGESSKPQSPQKAFHLGELSEDKRLQRLEVAQERQPRGRRWDQRRASRSYTHYGIQEEDQDWRMHQYDERRHQHHPSKPFFPYVKLPSFSGKSDPNIT